MFALQCHFHLIPMDRIIIFRFDITIRMEENQFSNQSTYNFSLSKLGTPNALDQ